MTSRAGVLLGALLLATAAVALAGCQDEPPRDAAGVVVPGTDASVTEGNKAFLLVPAGRIDVTVGDPITGDLPASEVTDDRIHRPPEGGSFVPVEWSHDPFALPPDLAVVGLWPEPTEMSLLVDGASYPLGSPYDVPAVGGTVDSLVSVLYVAVPTRPKSVRVGASYDGVTQTLDPVSGRLGPDAAAPLYHPVRRFRVDACPERGWTIHDSTTHGRSTADADVAGSAIRVDCHVGVARQVPYLPGVGWARTGYTWLVVPYRVQARADGAAVDSVRAVITLDGARPSAMLDRTGRRRSPAATVAFADTLGIRAGVAGRLDLTVHVHLAGGSTDTTKGTLTGHALLRLVP